MTTSTTPSIYDFTVNTLAGQPIALSTFKGKVLLIVNTASQCGFTPQYAGLQALYEKCAAQGLEILGFPCNQFGQQEPGSAQDIQTFCTSRYGVSFPLFEKIEVNGPSAHPLYQFLTRSKPGLGIPGLMASEAIKWNFTKFLVNRQGQVVQRYASMAKPEELEKDIQALL
ncbi:glutathione peroxidase [Synechocystis sp. LKSZ1]|uniref:glutathione peroxidase n=1 Tax=Synechocystis sp. LKSZ1 TaxID=3144951 RepID=UPI00336BBD9B